MFFMDLNTPIQSKAKWENTPFNPVRPCLKLKSKQHFAISNKSNTGDCVILSYVFGGSNTCKSAVVKFEFLNKGFFADSVIERFEIIPTSKSEVKILSFRISEKMKKAESIKISFISNSESSEFFVVEFIVASVEQVGLARARSFSDVRSQNEKNHFDFVFSKLAIPPSNNKGMEGVKPNLGFYIKEYYAKEVSPKISFRDRLEEYVKQKEKVKIISLCCGMAEVEMQIMRGLESCIEITFCDLNENLLKYIESLKLPFSKVSTMCCDINSISLDREAYDIVIFVSGLHHVVELEEVLSNVHRGLVSGGELWLIAEYIGRNGTRLFDDSYEVANSIFKLLPSHFRLNHITNEEDRLMPNFDCSAATYEAIRSEEIMGILEHKFSTVQDQRVNAFSWRFFNLIYQSNYNLNSEFDKSIIDFIIKLDAYYVKEKVLKPCNLNGVYSKKPT